jgi:hypothetical protein
MHTLTGNDAATLTPSVRQHPCTDQGPRTEWIDLYESNRAASTD